EREAISPGDFLDAGHAIQVQEPSTSSWGENGYLKVLINDLNSWMYPYQHDAERRMTELARSYRDRSSDEVTLRILNQLARELLLAQSSAWAFQIYKGTTVEYSTRRFKSHIQRFDLLANMLESGDVDHDLLDESERRDNIFAEIDFRAYLP